MRNFVENFPKSKGDMTLCNARSLKEFEHLDWIPIDFTQKLLNMRRTYDPRYDSVTGTESWLLFIVIA